MTEPAAVEAVVPAGASYPATPVYAAFPAGARRGVVVIHEIFGRAPEIDRVVDRFAAAGYAAVEPDLWRAPSAFGCIRATMTAMRTGAGPAVDQAAALRAWLCDRAGIAPETVGIIGFCFGGGFALAVGRGWGAVSSNYSQQIPSAPEALRGMGPTIGCFGGRDRTAGKNGAVLESRLRPLGVEVETHTYPTVGHSFLTDGDRPLIAALTAPLMHVRYDAAVAEDAWTKIIAFFDRRLEPVTSPEPGTSDMP